LIAASGLGMFLIFLLVRGSLIDDSYITLAYAKNLALHLHWGVVPQEFSNTATSPLNVVLLGALTAVTRIGGAVRPVLALGGLSVALAVIMAWGWIRIIRVWRLPLVVAALGVALVLVNPFLLSAVGLEVLLAPTLLIVLLVTALEERPGWFGLVAGLTVLCRLDLIVFVLLIAAATPTVRRCWRRSLGVAALVAMPWFVFSWVFFGSAVPDTLLIKTSAHQWIVSFLVGPVLYFTQRTNTTAVAFLPALIGFLGLVVWLVARTSVRWEPAHRLPAIGPAVALGAGGVAYYSVFAVLHVPPYHWYYVPPMTSLSMFLVIAVGVWLQRARERPRLRPAIPALILGVVGVLVLATLARDLMQGTPWRTPVISSNFASASDYARIGVALRKRVGNSTVQNDGEIGTVAYFCDCDLVEQFSDRGQVIPLINDRISQGGPLAGLVYKLNYLWLDRDPKPRHPAYLLRYRAGPGPSPGPDVWRVSSPSSLLPLGFSGHVTLSALPR